MNKPKEVNILGLVYSIEYVDKPSEVDIFKRNSLWGQIDYWTRTIRIYDNKRPESDLLETLMHEILHGITQALKIKVNGNDLYKDEDAIELLALALADTLIRNSWLK